VLGRDQSEHDGSCLVVRQHQRRHAEAGSQPVPAVPAATGLDRQAEVGQSGQVATDGAWFGLDAAGDLVAGHPPTVLQQIQQGEQAGGRSHGSRVVVMWSVDVHKRLA
jgi:hypothetical protein